MAIVTVNASLTGFATQASFYGTRAWSVAGSVLASTIPLGAGTSWLVWACQSSVPAGQALNAIQIGGGGIDFTVGGGGAGRLRIAKLYAKAIASFSFTGDVGTQIDSVAGTGTGKAISASVAVPGGMTSDNLRNGTVFIGVAVSTDNGDSALGDGLFRYGALAFTFYTGPDGATPPAGTPVTTMTNPAGNYSPGKYRGQQFAALTATLTTPLPQTAFALVFSCPVGMTFSNGSTVLSLPKGTTQDPGNPYTGSTGLINISNTIAPGSYTIGAQVNGIAGGNGPSGSTVIVNARRWGFPMMEV